MKKIVAAVLTGIVFLSLGGCKPKKSEPKTVVKQEAVKKMSGVKSIEGKEGLFAVISTDKGDIAIELLYKDTPMTVTNFVGLAEGTLDAAKGNPFYDGLKFHRVIADFMIQGGDPQGTGAGGPGYKFADEWCDKYAFDKPGYLAMANAGPNTNGSQFFITHVETPWLNGKHTIFGIVVDSDSQTVVNAVAQGDKMNSIKIYRQGADAEKFTATQADFNKMAEEAKKAALEAKKKANAAKIAAVEKAFPGFSTDENGIYWKTTKEGSGEKCGKRKSVTTEYKGYLVDGTVFDGSAKLLKGGHEPLDFMTAGGQMIPGFDIMVQDMKLGEVRTIVVPSDLAYGDQGYPGVIPGGAYIAFDIELVKIK